SAGYRLATLERLVADSLHRLAEGREAEGLPDAPVLLHTGTPASIPQFWRDADGHSERSEESSPPVNQPLSEIRTTINGTPVTWPAGTTRKTLLDALREDSRLTG